MEETTTISFNISKRALTMFELSLSLSNENKNTVLENFIYNYAKETLQKDLSTFSKQAKDTPPPVPILQNTLEETSNLELAPQSHPNIYSYPKVTRRISLWANRPSQFNHQIIKAFFLSEKDGKATRNEMKNIFLKNTNSTSWQFDNNFNSMLTDEGNSHGHVFDCNGDIVTITKSAQEVLNQFKNYFI